MDRLLEFAKIVVTFEQQVSDAHQTYLPPQQQHPALLGSEDLDEGSFPTVVPAPNLYMKMHSDNLIELCPVCEKPSKDLGQFYGARQGVCRRCKEYFRYCSSKRNSTKKPKNQERFRRCLDLGMVDPHAPYSIKQRAVGSSSKRNNFAFDHEDDGFSSIGSESSPSPASPLEFSDI